MRLAVFSDVHGNLTALEAVLKDIDGQTVDQILFAGDLCLVGPRPGDCLRRIQRSPIISIYGNTDDWILGRQTPPAHLSDLARWTLVQLSDSEQSWLDDLAFSHRISPSGHMQDDLLIVHANPLDVNQLIFPAEEEQMARYGRIRQTDDELRPLLASIEAAAIAFGHLHIPGTRHWHQIQLINISSVSMPGDGDPRAKYGIFEWTDGHWSFERHFVDYKIHLEVEAYKQAQPPGWEKIVATIETEGSFPQKV
ncbi:MAG: metallophosphoesterase family protein [Candidatus Promineifilaceae bacterium]|nr:metallophosphoesterase family protein [Candidatus Promineifilaceae bacterium]